MVCAKGYIIYQLNPFSPNVYLDFTSFSCLCVVQMQEK